MVYPRTPGADGKTTQMLTRIQVIAIARHGRRIPHPTLPMWQVEVEAAVAVASRRDRCVLSVIVVLLDHQFHIAIALSFQIAVLNSVARPGTDG